MEQIRQGSDVLFILLGAVMVLAMHAGFAFLELGTVRAKNQVNALVKILADFAVSTVAYFFVGYAIAYGVQFLVGADTLAQRGGYELVRFFFLLTFAAAIPAIVSGGIAEREERYGRRRMHAADEPFTGVAAAARPEQQHGDERDPAAHGVHDDAAGEVVELGAGRRLQPALHAEA